MVYDLTCKTTERYSRYRTRFTIAVFLVVAAVAFFISTMALVAGSSLPAPGLQEATKNSTLAWQEHLTDLFHHAKDRFPDVVWKVLDDEDDRDKQVGEVWGHKAIVYARAPPSFQNRYFSFRPNGAASPLPYSSSPSVGHYPADSAFSLSLESSLSVTPRTPSPFRAPSPTSTDAHVGVPTLLRLTTSINPTLFSNELEYLYTGKGFGEAFEFLFDTSESREHAHDDPESVRIDKLRKDLVYMWRSRLYSDVRIALTGNFGSSHESSTAIFSSHRFILVSRCSYFHTALIGWPQTKSAKNEPPTLTLPSPPFTPASLHFTLGFIYTGTLVFSHRSYDLSTAFALMRAALYLALTTLHDEVQARIAQEMLHGLFHAFLPFSEYDGLTNGRWGSGGCRCRQCARRVPRVLEFASSPDVNNEILERGAKRALVGLFGEGWCTQEFAALSPKIREAGLKGVAKRTTPLNAFPLLFAAEHGLLKLGNNIEPWADVVKEMIFAGRKGVDELLARESESCFTGEDWMEIMESDGVRFEDGERVEWAMAAVLRGVKEPYAPSLYQTLVSSILLRPHPTEVNAPMLPATSHIRVQVEQTRLELLKWIGKRWLVVRQERGFDALEGWALKEISDHIEVPIDDLLSPPSYSSPKKQHRQPGLLRPMSNHPHTSKVDAESDVASSMRVSVLSRSMHVSRSGGASASSVSVRDRSGATRDRTATGLSSSTSSVRSVARSTHSVASTASVSTIPANRTASHAGMSPARKIASDVRAAHQAVDMKDRPDSKLSPSSSSVASRTTEPMTTSRTPSPRLQLSIVEPEGEEELGEEESQESQEQDVVMEYDGTPEPSENGDDQSQNQEDEDMNTTEDGDAADSIHQTPPPAQKTLITRASLASVSSRTSTRTGTSVAARTKPGEVSKSVSHASIRKSTASTYSLARTSPSGLNSPRPNSRGSVASTTRSRLTVVTTKPSASSAPRPTSRVSTRSVSGGTGASRPTSRVSTATDHSSSFRTASVGLSTPTTATARSRRTSAASNVSVRTAGGRSTTNSPVQERTRRTSGASVNSVASNATGISTRSTTRTVARSTPVKRAAPPVPAVDASKLSPATAAKSARAPSMKNSISASSVASTTSKKSTPSTSTGTAVRKGVLSKKSVESLRSPAKAKASDVPQPPLPPPVKPEEPVAPVEPVPVSSSNADVDMESEKENQTPAPPPSVPIPAEIPIPPPSNTSSAITIRPGIRHEILASSSSSEHKKTSSSASSSSVATLRRKGSTDTIKTVKSSGLASTTSDGSSKQSQRYPLQPHEPGVVTTLPTSKPALSKQVSSISSVLAQNEPQGAMLEIGIPCIISSKRKRFKAYARYIGEVVGETGPWVGVEVPMPVGDSWGEDRPADDRQWNDGTWGGIRYFEMGSMGSEWEYGDDRAARRRRLDASIGGGSSFWDARDKGILKREGDQLSISSDRMKRMRSVSPAASDMSGTESRGLFVRPQQVLYVVDAVGSDL